MIISFLITALSKTKHKQEHLITLGVAISLWNSVYIGVDCIRTLQFTCTVVLGKLILQEFWRI